MRWSAVVLFCGLFLLAGVLVSAVPARFDNFELYSVSIETSEQLAELQAISRDTWIFLDEPKFVGQNVEIIVSPLQKSAFNELSQRILLKGDLLVPNFQTLIDRGNVKPRADGDYDLNAFNRVDEMYAWLDTLPEKYPEIVTRIKGGETSEKRTIEGVKLSKNPNNPAIFIESNIHAREWITSASTNWIINELLTSTDPEVQALLDNYNWYIFPVVNPDGYEYTHTDYRMWRKTRSRNGIICWGTDPNRNWDIQWQAGGIGASDDPCSDTFAGTKVFSEVETRTLSEFATSIKDEIKIYLAFHSAARMILSPWGHTADVPEDHAQQMEIMTAAYDRLHAVHGTVYTYGNTFETICELGHFKRREIIN